MFHTAVDGSMSSTETQIERRKSMGGDGVKGHRDGASEGDGQVPT